MFSSENILQYLAICVLVIIPFWKIFKKAGFSPYLSLLTVVPIVNLVTVYYVAFSKWSGKEATR
jgi:hypothetical protein